MAVVDFSITSRKPYAGGVEFGDAGAYEQVDGLVTFSVDPADEANRAIVDLDLAPRDASGKVRFRSDFSLVQPLDPAKANGRVLVELPNRGRKLFGTLNHARALDGAVPGSDPGDGFLMRRGWSIASIGWQWDVIRSNGLLGFDAPPVLIDGLAVSGQNIVTIRPNKADRCFLLANRVHDSYPVLRPGDPAALLYVRDHEYGEDSVIPRGDWSFAQELPDGSTVASQRHIYLKAGFIPGKTYNVVYEAGGARVVGAGLLAFRDIAPFLRRPSESNPAANGFDRVYGYGVSQTGRMLRHFLYLGLNRDEAAQQAYDGLHVHVAGARRGEFNHRFAQPSVQPTPNFGHLFPYADDESVDLFSEHRDGLFKQQRELGGMPKVVYTNTSAEYWRGDGALAHIDPAAMEDLAPAPESRIYHFAGTQHIAGVLPQTDRNATEGTRGRYGFNLIDYIPLLRAALLNLDAWVSEGVEPPESKHPRLRDSTLVAPEQTLEALGRLPGVTPPATDLLWALRETDLGAEAGRGIGRYPAVLGRSYPMLVPAVDSDGNEKAGIRLPDLSVPVATNTGWNPRHPETGSRDQIVSMMGWTKYFPATAADAARAADPRRSLAERYGGKEEYLELVRGEAEKLAADRYIVEEDVELLVSNAAQRYDAALAAAALPRQPAVAT